MKGEEAVRRLLAGEPDALEAIATAFTPLVHYVISAITICLRFKARQPAVSFSSLLPKLLE